MASTVGSSCGVSSLHEMDRSGNAPSVVDEHFPMKALQ
jgi:hypothetical protein